MMFQRILSYIRRQTLATCALFPQSPARGRQRMEGERKSTGGFFPRHLRGKTREGKLYVWNKHLYIFEHFETIGFGLGIIERKISRKCSLSISNLYYTNYIGTTFFLRTSDVAGWLFCGSGRVGLTEVRVGSGRAGCKLLRVGSGRAEQMRVGLKLRAQT